MLKNGTFGQDFNGNILSSLGVSCKLNLGKCPFTNSSANFILPKLSLHFLHHWTLISHRSPKAKQPSTIAHQKPVNWITIKLISNLDQLKLIMYYMWKCTHIINTFSVSIRLPYFFNPFKKECLFPFFKKKIISVKVKIRQINWNRDMQFSQV